METKSTMVKKTPNNPDQTQSKSQTKMVQNSFQNLNQIVDMNKIIRVDRFQTPPPKNMMILSSIISRKSKNYLKRNLLIKSRKRLNQMKIHLTKTHSMIIFM